jgi:dTDP-4-dehydrorhamnose 3,5-epimerase
LIPGVAISPLNIINGPAGSVLHALKKSWKGYAGFGEAYFSEIHQGAVKSWRRHKVATLNLVVPLGAIRFVLHDEQEFDIYDIGRSSNYARLTIPPDVWFAFQGIGLGPSLLLSVSTNEHDPDEAETCELSSIPYSW